MIKHVLNQFNAAMFAEIALVIFAIAFIAVVIKTLTTKKEEMDDHSMIVLSDPPEKPSE